MDAATLPIPIVRLQRVGNPAADACEGDSCRIPEHHQQAVINRRIDDNAV
jgi:hypothetical protein